MDVDRAAFYSRLITNGSLVQLLLCFLLSNRPDPYNVAPVIALYAVRENDRRAMLLYLVVTCLAAAFELIFLFHASLPTVLGTLGVVIGCIMKLCMLYLGLKLHDQLPERRAPRVEAAILQEQISAVVERVLREQLERLTGLSRPVSAHAKSKSLPKGVEGAPHENEDGSWETV